MGYIPALLILQFVSLILATNYKWSLVYFYFWNDRETRLCLSRVIISALCDIDRSIGVC